MSTVLIVDDSQTVRGDLTEALEASGFRAVPCTTVAEAWIALRSQPIALAILDVRLPDGDGIELLDAIRPATAPRKLPVLMLSTEAAIKDRVRALRGGANDFVGKPYDPTQIIARVRQLIGAPPVRDLVLIIDDSATSRGALGEALGAAGFVIAMATG